MFNFKAPSQLKCIQFIIYIFSILIFVMIYKSWISSWVYVENNYLSDSSRQIIQSTPKNCSYKKSKLTHPKIICNEDINSLPLTESEKWIAILFYGEFKPVFPMVFILIIGFLVIPLLYKSFKFVNKKLVNSFE